MGPPTPDSEERTHSLAACAATPFSTVSLRGDLQVGQPQPGHASERSLHVLYLALFLATDERDRLLQRSVAASCVDSIFICADK